jgi:hypothetical protein
VQFAGQREDEVEIVDGQDALKAGLDPTGLIERLTLGTVAISAGVVGRRLEAAVRAAVQVAAERRCPARDDGACNVVLAFCQGVALAIVVEVAAKDVRHPNAGRTTATSDGHRACADIRSVQVLLGHACLQSTTT